MLNYSIFIWQLFNWYFSYFGLQETSCDVPERYSSLHKQKCMAAANMAVYNIARGMSILESFYVPFTIPDNFFLFQVSTLVLKIRKTLQPVLPVKSSLENIMVEFICHEQVSQMFDWLFSWIFTYYAFAILALICNF